MRKGIFLGALAALLATAVPACAQMGVGLGGPGFLTSPEAASGAFGAGAAQGAAQQQQCMRSGSGRDGPRGVCLSDGPKPAPRR